jgi:hypothetical protein
MPEEELSPDEVQRYLASHKVLHLVHRSLNAAVRDHAPNPLLHMARSLRAHAGVAPPPPCADVVGSESPSPQPVMAASPAEVPSGGASLRSTSGERLEPLDVRTEAQLSALLAEGGVDTSEWGGAGGAAGRAALLAELRASEATLCRAEEGGGLVRVVRHVEVELLLRGRVLVLTHEEVDGHARQQFTLPRAKLLADEATCAAAAHRALFPALGLPSSAVELFDERDAEAETSVCHPSSWPASACPSLVCEATRYVLKAALHAIPGEAALAGTPAASERFCTSGGKLESKLESQLAHGGGGGGGTSRAPVGGGEGKRKLHWGWYPVREWETVRRKKQLEARARAEEASRASAGGGTAEGAPRVRVRYDGLGEQVGTLRRSPPSLPSDETPASHTSPGRMHHALDLSPHPAPAHLSPDPCTPSTQHLSFRARVPAG